MAIGTIYCFTEWIILHAFIATAKIVPLVALRTLRARVGLAVGINDDDVVTDSACAS